MNYLLMKNIALKTTIILTNTLYLISTNAYSDGPIDGDIYGRMNVSYQHEKNEADGDVWKLASNASRLGFKGKSLVDNQIKIVYQIEYGVEVDDGDKNGQTISQRDTFIGIAGAWGKLIAGRITIPFKEAKGNIDRFNDLQGELGKIIDGEERINNIVQYSSENLLGALVSTIAIVPGENTKDSNKNGPADGVSGSLVFDNKKLYFALAFNSNIKEQDQWRLATSWQWGTPANGSLSVGALYQHSKINNDSQLTYADGQYSTDAYGFSSQFTHQKNTFKAQYILSNRSISLSDARQFSFAIEHKLGERSTLYAYYADRDSAEAAQSNSYLAIGLKHNF